MAFLRPTPSDYDEFLGGERETSLELIFQSLLSPGSSVSGLKPLCKSNLVRVVWSFSLGYPCECVLMGRENGLNPCTDRIKTEAPQEVLMFLHIGDFFFCI